ncbi:hypothetical protein I5Q34_13925 [Streptomyces sp. AV19]|uniref:hypothetical protein n=1 Tax=Streptomyces sp. AV19 TaxID=2793068 RepID=UPI0018FE7F18|nr:hypothetical protein [Streptomyces sp. AV19]MBH1935357.1 hypothetical protein [Streptomyces sp. AV19]MDG4531243.1 hypothetical protein [Streptomyces sp. AV19]
MEAELTALAASGATTLVGLMVTDAWSQARGRVARFFARGGEDEAAVDDELRRDGEELAAREDGPAAAEVERRWRDRLRQALRDDPGAAGELRGLLAELEPAGRAEGGVHVHNNVIGGTQYGPVVQGQNFSGLTFDMRGAVPPRREPGRD